MDKTKSRWVELDSYTNNEVWQGDKLKVKNMSKNHEETILMFFDPLDEDVSLGLVVIMGHYAGVIEYLFPTEAYAKETTGISVEWLKKHWNEYNEVKLSDVKILIEEKDTSFLNLKV